MRHYEVMVILDPDLEERTVAPSLDTFLNVVKQDGGTVDKVDASADATPDGPGPNDAGVDSTPGFDASTKDASVQDAFIAQDGFCCPLYGGSPGH